MRWRVWNVGVSPTLGRGACRATALNEIPEISIGQPFYRENRAQCGDFLRIQYLSSNEIITAAKDWTEKWPTLEETEKRRIVETITKRIEVGKDKVEIKLCYEPSPLEMAAGKGHDLGDLPHENMPTSKDKYTMNIARYLIAY